MNEQISIFDFLKQKPLVGSIIYFATGGKVVKATIISYDASFAGIPYRGYIKVRDIKGQTWSVKKYYNSHAEAKKYISRLI